MAGRYEGNKPKLAMDRVYTVLMKITKGKVVSVHAMKAYTH